MPVSRYILGTIPWYSVLVVTGIAAAIGVASWGEKKKGLPRDTIIDLALWLVPFGIIGARLYYVIFAWNSFRGDPVSVLYIWNGGLAIYGGIIAGFITALLFAWKRKIPPMRLLDIIAPGVALAQAIGRWGNFFNMEAYGAIIRVPALQFFPMAVQIPESGTLVWHMATFFYESCWDLACFLVLICISRRIKKDGCVFLWYILLYGAGRMLIEGLRTDSLMSIDGGVRVSQLLSACIALAAAVTICWKHADKLKRKKLLVIMAVLVAAIAVLLTGKSTHVFPGSEWIFAAAAGLAVYTGCAGVMVRRNKATVCISLLPGILLLTGMLYLSACEQRQGLGYYLASCLCIDLILITTAAVQCVAIDKREGMECR